VLHNSHDHIVVPAAVHPNRLSLAPFLDEAAALITANRSGNLGISAAALTLLAMAASFRTPGPIG
jgi:hypothetical protein